MRFETLVGIQLWLVIINLGIALGAGLYEARSELNHLRHAFTFVALLAAMKAFGAFQASKSSRLSG